MTLVENWDTSPSDSSSVDDYESTVEEVERAPTILPNYLNNLTLAFNFNNRINAFETSLWKLYQHHSPPSLLAITNLWTQLQDNDAEANAKRKEFEAVQRKTNAEVQRRLGPKINCQQGPDLSEHLEEEGVEGELDDQEFWTQFLGFKTEGRETQVGSASPPVNAFYNRFYLSTYDKIKLCLMSVVLVLRFLLIIFLLCIATSLALIGTIALPTDQLQPFSWWRRSIRWVVGHVVMRAVWFVTGFYWVRTLGTRASPKEAPVIVAAPHSSYFDAFVVTYLGGPSVVAKADAKNLTFFGRLIDFTQPIYVNRDDPLSRTGCVNEIRRRVKSELEFSQVFLFPEGTCTNRSCLAEFKPGGFLAGVPVQPVVIRYPNRLDSVTWTFDGPSAAWSGFVSLTQFYLSMEIEFLPVYTPSEEEKSDTALFSRNVQKVMAESLGVPATNFSMEDGKVLMKLSQTKIREKMRNIWKIKGDLNLREAATETTLAYDGINSDNFEWKMRLEQFQEIFHVHGEESPPEIQQLFNLFRQGEDETIDLRAYLMLACFLYSDAKLDLLVTLMFKMFAGQKREIKRDEFLQLMKNLFEATEKDANDLFNATHIKETPLPTTIGFAEFQRKMQRRVEYLKLYAMEETGQRSGNFPLRSQRDQHPKTKTE